MKFCLIMLIFLSASLIAPEPTRGSFIVWNIGQGQWTTRVSAEECWHFDMGGEFFPWKQIQRTCGNKKRNVVFLSHWDWDHIGGLTKAAKYLPNLCIARRPLGPSSMRKEALIPPAVCANYSPDWEWRPEFSKKLSANDLSQVFIKDGFLIPGDSTRAEESIWANLLPLTKSVKFLILGHHGSKTSSSDFLFAHLPGLRMAISTARWKRYHHPHPETLARLRKYQVPAVRTEDWGSLRFEL